MGKIRAGDKVKCFNGYDQNGIVQYKDGSYVFVILDGQNHLIEFLDNEIEVIELVSDEIHKQYMKSHYEKIILVQQEVIMLAEEKIESYRKKLKQL